MKAATEMELAGVVRLAREAPSHANCLIGTDAQLKQNLEVAGDLEALDDTIALASPFNMVRRRLCGASPAGTRDDSAISVIRRAFCARGCAAPDAAAQSAHLGAGASVASAAGRRWRSRPPRRRPAPSRTILRSDRCLMRFTSWKVRRRLSLGGDRSPWATGSDRGAGRARRRRTRANGRRRQGISIT